jgi:uncharacterized protein
MKKLETMMTHVTSILITVALVGCGKDGNDKNPLAAPAKVTDGPKTSLPDRLARACEAGSGQQCVELSYFYLKGLEGVTKDDARAYEYVGKACKAGDMFGCELQGKMLRDGRGTEPDFVSANALFIKACDGNSYGACTSLALDTSKRNPKAAVPLFVKACNGDDGLGCMGLGALYLHGNGVKKDTARAKELLAKSCKLGVDSACKKVDTL